MQETQVQSPSWEDPLEKEKGQPTPVFLPGESNGQRSLVGYSLWDGKESDITERLSNSSHILCRLKETQAVSRTLHGVSCMYWLPGGSEVKNLPAMRETQVQSLSWEDPLGKGMVAPSSMLAWRIPWTEKPGGLQSMGSERVGHDSLSLSLTHTCLTQMSSFSTLPFPPPSPQPQVHLCDRHSIRVSPFLNCNWTVAVFFFFYSYHPPFVFSFWKKQSCLCDELFEPDISSFIKEGNNKFVS